MRRKKKAVSRSTGADSDRKITAAVKKLGVQPITGVEEVNLFRQDSKVVHFKNPKVQAATQANTFVVSGNAETKNLMELMPGIANQLGQELSNHMHQQMQAGRMQQPKQEDSDDDDVPELVGEDFQATAAK